MLFSLYSRFGFLGCRSACVMAGVIYAMVGASVAHAAGDLKAEIERQVSIVASAMRDARDVAIKEFESGSTDAFSGHIGPGLREIFIEEFKRKGIALNDNAEHLLTGQYFTTSRKLLTEGKPLRLTIKLGLTKRDGEVPVTLLPIEAQPDAKHFAEINSTKDLAQAIGFTGVIPPDGTAKERQETIIPQVLTPAVVIDGTRIRSNPKSEYEVVVRKRPRGSSADFKPFMPTLEQGQLFAPVEINEEYDLMIYNRSKLPVAVSVTIDGLDMFHFAEPEARDANQKPKYSHFIISPNDDSANGGSEAASTNIAGWFRKLSPPDNYSAFLVTEHGKGAVSKVSAPRDSVGAIHVRFAHCVPLENGAQPKSGAETGFGVPRSIAQKEVNYQIDPPHDFVTIRYLRPKK